MPATNVAELVRDRVASDPDKVAIVDGDSRLTWQGLNEWVDELARGLTQLDVVAGHRVAIAQANGVSFVASYLAALRGGTVAVPVNVSATPGEIARILTDSGARVCFTDNATVSAVRSAAHALTHGDPRQRLEPQPGIQPPVLVVTGDRVLPGEVAAADVAVGGAPVLSPRDVEALAVLLYTSGTSGRPRGAMLTHRALLANIDAASRTEPPPVRPDDIVLGVLPLSHVYGLNAVLGQVLLQGATLVVGRRFDPEETLRLIAAEQVTCVPVAPPVIGAWLRRDDAAALLASVRTVVSGAAPLPDRVVAAFRERTGLTVEQGYGLTEAGPIVTSTIGTPTFKPGSAGRALPGVEVRVVDDTGHDAGPDDPGEICVRGRNLFSGYWPDGDAAPEPGGWLATGDIGFLDNEGDLFLVDRLKELVIVSGFNVYPSEVEDVVGEVAGVSECAVIGVPDEATGEAVVAYVVGERRAQGDDETLVQRVAEHCAQRLARFKVPTKISVVGELPHSATGKVAKGRLRAANERRMLGLT